MAHTQLHIQTKGRRGNEERKKIISDGQPIPRN